MSAQIIYNLALAPQTASGNSGNIGVSGYVGLAVDINITLVSGTGSPTLQLFVDRLAADGSFYNIWTGVSHTTATTESTSIGAGLTQASAFAATIRLRWVITGTTPSFTFSASIIAN